MRRSAERTHPELWKRTVARVKAGTRGGLAGQWSARKAQLAVKEYKDAGGGYVGPKSSQLGLVKWTKQRWRTKSGEPSLVTGERYLPAKAIKALSVSEYAATTRAKRKGLSRGEQFTRQPRSISKKVKPFRQNARSLGAAVLFGAVLIAGLISGRVLKDGARLFA